MDLSHLGNLRGHKFKLEKGRFRTNLRKHSFRNRVINIWNGLPSEVINIPTLNIFKNRLVKHWEHLKYETK